MPPPERPARVDSYGKPLPELADVREQVRFEEEVNETRRRYLYALVEESCRAVLRRGWHGDIHVRFSVIDGIIQTEMRAGLERLWRVPREARGDSR